MTVYCRHSPGCSFVLLHNTLQGKISNRRAPGQRMLTRTPLWVKCYPVSAFAIMALIRQPHVCDGDHLSYRTSRCPISFHRTVSQPLAANLQTLFGANLPLLIRADVQDSSCIMRHAIRQTWDGIASAAVLGHWLEHSCGTVVMVVSSVSLH